MDQASSSSIPSALTDEIESINAIFGDNTLSLTKTPSSSSETQTHILILTLPFHSTSLRLAFPHDYPASVPSVLGPESSLSLPTHSTASSSSTSVSSTTSGSITLAAAKKGEAADFAAEARRVLEGCWRVGEPCVFDLVEELREGVEKAQQHRDSEASQARAVTGGEESGKDDAASVFSSDGEGGTSDLESDEEASTTSTTPTPTATTAKTSPNHLASLGGKAASAASAAAGGATVVFNALIRTHHVTSRKKVGKVKKAAQHELRYLLIRSGGSPGLMYAEGEEGALREWVAGVAALRYKDYHLARPPAPLSVSRAVQASASTSTSKPSSTAHKHDARNDTAKKLAAAAEDTAGYEEVDSVANFAEAVERRGVLRWWRVAMGYEGGGDVIG